MKKTKIIATMGPAVETEEKIIELYKAGINIIRFNFSHANKENVKQVAGIIKKLNNTGVTNLSLLLDTKGPEIRTGDMEKPYEYKKGEEFRICVKKEHIEKENDLLCDYPHIIDDMKEGESIIIDSGTFIVKILKKEKKYLLVKAENSAFIKSRRHINLPGLKLKFGGLTEQDKEDILFGIEQDMDFIAASFIRSKENVEEIRAFLKKNKGENIKIISKIENQEGIENRNEIILASDGVMVARGDLGIEVPVTKLAIYQKELVETCQANAKIAIVATHFLESMIVNPTPTRAETSDIAHAVWQLPDSLMLSGETSIGSFAIDSVKMMSSIMKESEKHIEYSLKDYSNKNLSPRDVEKKYLIKHGLGLCDDTEAKAIIIFTKSGLLARLGSMCRPRVPIYAFTKKETSLRYMNLLFGVQSFLLQDWKDNNYEENLDHALFQLNSLKKLKKHDKVIVINDIQRNGIEVPVLEIVNVGEYR